MDRVLEITIEAQNELGDLAPYRLIGEIMGKYSNIILVDDQGRILDAIRRVGPGMSSVRMLLPGLTYSSPPGPMRTGDPEPDSGADRGGISKRPGGQGFVQCLFRPLPPDGGRPLRLLYG